ncbi:unnamed protein product [Closterium sp. NIES-53]
MRDAPYSLTRGSTTYSSDSATRSQWLTRDAAARLAICNHLPLTECAHFEQHRTTQALYVAVVACYSSPATAALGCLLLPYQFPELSAFAIVEDLVSHLCTSNARYRAATPAEFLDRNQPPMFITLYFIVNRLPDSLRSVTNQFLSLDPTVLTLDLLEQHLLAAETSVVAVGASRGTPRTPFFEGCSPSPLAPSYASAAAVDVPSAEDVGAASASAKRRSSKGKGGRGGGGGSGSGGGGSSGGGGGSGGGGSGGSGGGSGGFGGGGGGSGGSGGSGSGGSGGSRSGAQRGGSGGGQRQRQQRRSETPSPQQLREWLFQRGASGGTPPSGYFMLVVDDYTRYTTVFPLRSKGEVSAVLIPWIRTVRLQLRELFGQDLPVLRLHSDRGGEFSSNLLREFCRGEGIRQLFMLPDSPKQNGIAERRIGLVMEVARTSMIHAAAPHFQWSFAVQYAAHQLKLWPRLSLPKTSPTLHWTGKVGDASVFRVWGSRAFVRDTSADKSSAHAIPCVFLGFVPDTPGWQFYHPTSRRVLSSQDITFDELVPFYRLFPYRSAPPPPPPLFLAPDPLLGNAPVQVAIVSGAAPGAASGGAEPGGAGSEGAGSGGAEPEGVEPGGAESEGAEPRGAESEGAESGGAEPQGAASSGGPAAGEPGDTGAGGAAGAGAGDPTEPGEAGAGGAGTGVAGVGGPGAGGAGAAGAGAVDPRAGGAGGTVWPGPYFVPLLQQVLGVPSSTGLPPPFLCPPHDQLQPPL